MPAALIVILRYAVMQIVASGLVWAAESAIDYVVKALVKLFGATEEQAEAVVGNEIFNWIERIGLTAVAFYTKIPQRTAARLGFTSEGFKPKKIAGTEKITGGAAAGSAVSKTVATAEVVEKVLEQRTLTQGLSKAVAVLKIGVISSAVGTVTSVMLAAAQYIDFGAWNSSAYQGTFQKVLAFFGLEADQQYVKAKVLSGEMFTKLFSVWEQAGAVEIIDPKTGAKLPFTRDNLVPVADYLGSQVIFEQGTVSTRQMMAALTAFIVLDPERKKASSVSQTQVSAGAGSQNSVKVFTGIVSQGTLGSQLSFKARQDDLIENEIELQQAVSQNLAAYMTTLPGRIVYEVKVVPTITTRDGFRQVGASQNVRVGTYPDGSPKYKTVVNKFAVVTLYVLTDSGSRSKITTIVVGPTNAATFAPSTQQLAILEKTIQNSLFTSNLNDIKAVQNENAIPSAESNKIFTTAALEASAGNAPALADVLGSPVMLPGTAGEKATNLKEWYEANSKPLPTVEQRSVVYEELGLGQRTFYTGTYEQNSRLLAALKSAQSMKSATTARVDGLPSISTAPQGGKKSYYNNGRNGTPREVYGEPSYWQNRAYDKEIGKLISNPTKRDIPGNLLPAFYNGDISLEEFAAAVGASPDYKPEVGPLINYGSGDVPNVAL